MNLSLTNIKNFLLTPNEISSLSIKLLFRNIYYINYIACYFLQNILYGIILIYLFNLNILIDLF